MANSGDNATMVLAVVPDDDKTRYDAIKKECCMHLQAGYAYVAGCVAASVSCLVTRVGVGVSGRGVFHVIGDTKGSVFV